MYMRDLSGYSKEEQEIYNKIFEETRQMFIDKVGKLAIIHSIMIDRLVSTYIDLLQLDSVKTVSEKKYKTVQDKFQSWTKSILDSLYSVSVETEAKKVFYERIVRVLTEEVKDEKSRKQIFNRILDEAVYRGER